MILIPSVSLGNVPQLALDLLLHTYEFELVKSLNADINLTPFVGPMDYTTTKSSLIATPCQLYDFKGIKIVQIRSPPLPGKKMEFANALKTELDDDKVLVLGSALPTKTAKIGYLKDEKLIDSGFVHQLVNVFNAEALISYCYEGDNKQDAFEMANELVRILNLEVKEFVEPVSWSKLYGGKIKEELYT